MDLAFDVPVPLVKAELQAYLADAADPEAQPLATRCAPWTVRDLTAHVGLTFARFNRLLAQARAGDFTPPFEPRELKHENLRAVAAFTGDARELLSAEAGAFLNEAGDQDELIAHQFGPLPMRIQLGFALSELAIHHQDLAEATRDRYEPPAQTVGVLAQMWTALGGLPLPEPGDTDWKRVLRASGR